MQRDEIRTRLEELWQKQTLAGAWLFSGPEGLGKATLAIELAEYILAGGTYANQTVKSQVATASHPDMLLIRRGLTDKEKKERQKIVDSGKALDDKTEAERSRNPFITVDDIRGIDGFIHMSASGSSSWKVVIIDSADEMNINAANAVLKVLEEPPSQTVMILISHNPAKLLPTILSRCRKASFSPLSETEVAEVLRKTNPELSASEITTLSRLAEGSPGKAISLLSADALSVFGGLLRLFSDFPKVNAADFYKFAEKYEKDELAYTTLKDLYITWLYRLIRMQAAGEMEAPITDEEQAVSSRVISLADKEKLLGLWEKSTVLFNQADNLYLDKKQVMVNSLLELSSCL